MNKELLNKLLSDKKVVIASMISLSIVIAALLISISLIAINNQNRNNDIKITTTPTITPTNIITTPSFVSTTTPTPTITAEKAPNIKDIKWQDKINPFVENIDKQEFRNHKLFIKIPEGWNFETIEFPTNSAANPIDCVKYTIKSPKEELVMNIETICTKWTEENNPWPSGSVLVQETNRGSKDGYFKYYKIRYFNEGTYNYLDGRAKSDGGLNKSMGIIGSVMLIYGPPEESTYDYLVFPAKVNASISNSVTDKEGYLLIADEIAKNIFFHR